MAPATKGVPSKVDKLIEISLKYCLEGTPKSGEWYESEKKSRGVVDRMFGSGPDQRIERHFSNLEGSLWAKVDDGTNLRVHRMDGTVPDWVSVNPTPDDENAMVRVEYILLGVPAAAAFEFLCNKSSSPVWHEDVDTVTDLTKEVATHWKTPDLIGCGEKCRLTFNMNTEWETRVCANVDVNIWNTKYKMPKFLKAMGFQRREISELRVCARLQNEIPAYLICSSSLPLLDLCYEYKNGRSRILATTPDYVMGCLYMACQYAEDICDSSLGVGCRLIFISHVNPIPKGIPQWVITRLAHRKPKEFVESFAKYARSRYRKVKSGEVTLSTEV